MKKLLLVLTSLCLALLLCSCWDYTELNLRHIATGLALDEGETFKYLMTVEIMSFEGEKASATTGPPSLLESRQNHAY